MYNIQKCLIFSISGKVDNSVKQMGRLLSEIKGGGQGQAISKSGQHTLRMHLTAPPDLGGEQGTGGRDRPSLGQVSTHCACASQPHQTRGGGVRDKPTQSPVSTYCACACTSQPHQTRGGGG